jgi:signal transduction histidine kinase
MQFFQVNRERLLQTTIGFIPIAVLLISLVLLVTLNIDIGVFDPPYLQFILQAIFVLASSIVITIASARAYLGSGSLNILLLGSAVFISGLASTVASWAVNLSANEAAIIGNIGILISSFVMLLSAIVTLIGTNAVDNANRKKVLVAVYLSAPILFGFVSAFAAFNLMPVFLSATGPTSVRLVVLAVSIVFYLESSLMYGWRYFQVKSTILYWYSLALGLISLSLVAAFLTMSFGDIINWVSRIALYLSGVYFLLAFLTTQNTEEKTSVGILGKWAEAFRSDPKQMTVFFSRMSEAFAYCKILTNADGQPIDYVFLDTNSAFEMITRLKKDRVLGKKATEVINLGNAPKDWIGIVGHVALTGEPVTLESFSEATKQWFHISVYSPQKNFFVSISEDITKRKEAELLEKDYQNRLKMAQHIAHLGSWEYYVTEDRAYWSEELFHIFHLKPSMVGPDIKEFTEFIHKDDSKIVEQKMTALLSEGRLGDIISFDYRIVLSDASLRVLHTQRMVTGVDEAGHVSKILGIEQDITERNSIEQQLEKYRKHLEELVEQRTRELKDAERLSAIGATAGMVGHDIRNPLQAIISELYLAKQAMGEVPKDRDVTEAIKSIDFIEEQADYISKIVADLQDYARPLNPEFTEVELCQFIDDAFKALAIPDGVKARLVCERQVLFVKLDRTFMKRVLTNLSTNAVQAMPKGGKLTVKASRENNSAVIVVEDTGVGIPDDVKAKIFTPMFTTKAKGQGFGLAVVKRLVEAQGGTIGFESEVGKGTRFIVKLPLKR